MDKTIDFPKKDQLVDALRKDDIVFAAIFGSRAKGTARSDSDYDILVEFNPDNPIPFSKFYKAKEHVVDILGSNIDFLTLKSLSKFMRDDVTRSMKVIYDDRARKR